MRGRLAPGNGAKCVRIRERTPVFISFFARFLSIFERFLCYLHGFCKGFARVLRFSVRYLRTFYGAFSCNGVAFVCFYTHGRAYPPGNFYTNGGAFFLVISKD